MQDNCCSGKVRSEWSILYLSLFPSWWFGINTKWPLCVWWVSQCLSLCVSCHWSSLRSSIRRLNPGEAWSGSASDCWFRHSISLPTCKIPISIHSELWLQYWYVKALSLLNRDFRYQSVADLTDPAEFRHPEEELPELAGHLRVVGHGVLLQGVHHLLLTSAHCIRVLQTTRI